MTNWPNNNPRGINQYSGASGAAKTAAGTNLFSSSTPEVRSVSAAEIKSGKLDESRMGPAELAFRRQMQSHAASRKKKTTAKRKPGKK